MIGGAEKCVNEWIVGELPRCYLVQSAQVSLVIGRGAKFLSRRRFALRVCIRGDYSGVMAGQTDVPVRMPAFAGFGRFYPDEASECRRLAREYLDGAPQAPSATRWIGGIVPHAGWICSGAIAGQTIANIAHGGVVDLVVVFGAIHTPLAVDAAVLDEYALWQEPGETSEVACELRARVAQSRHLFRVDNRFHAQEHAVEVELPLIQQALPGSAILPVEVPLNQTAVEVGRATARQVNAENLRAIFLASSDFTHYGPAYRFTPAGIGLPGLEWARSNDRILLELIEKFRPEDVVAEVQEHYNACGGGAIAAMMAACREFGAGKATVLRHASSYETLSEVAPQRPDNAVGYASVVVG